eukprot:scaffold3048_cov192-Amphora_coffeaeformis.AAC.5
MSRNGDDVLGHASSPSHFSCGDFAHAFPSPLTVGGLSTECNAPEYNQHKPKSRNNDNQKCMGSSYPGFHSLVFIVAVESNHMFSCEGVRPFALPKTERNSVLKVSVRIVNSEQVGYNTVAIRGIPWSHEHKSCHLKSTYGGASFVRLSLSENKRMVARNVISFYFNAPAPVLERLNASVDVKQPERHRHVS